MTAASRSRLLRRGMSRPDLWHRRKKPSKRGKRMKRSLLNTGLLLAIFVLTSPVTSCVATAQGNPNPGVIPVNASPYGATYGEWSARWWQWAFSLPVDHHPLFDTADCSAGQSGPVWFLGASFV